MTTFEYQALSPGGETIAGVLEAFDQVTAVQQIRELYPVILSIRPVKLRKKRDGPLFASKIKAKSLAAACSQLSIVLQSGLPIVRALELIAAQTSDPSLRRVFEQVTGDVAAGYTLAASFASRGGDRLPPVFIETIRAGEESGTLDDSFARLHKYFDKSSKVRAKTIAALTYPAFVLVVAAVVIVIIMVMAIPMFTSTFASMGAELPLPTRIIIGMSHFVTQWGPLAFVIVAALIIAAKTWQRKTEQGRTFFAKRALQIPVLGKIARMKGAGQFAGTMSILLAAGLPIMQSIATTARVMNNFYLSSQVSTAAFALEEGRRLGDVLRRCQDLPPLLAEMTSVGEEAGSLEETLEVVSDFYDNEVEMATSKALSLLEPILIVGLAAFVVLVLLAVYLAVFTLYGSY